MIAQLVMANRGRNKVAWNQLGALMDQLVKGMLTVSARLAPDNRARFVRNSVAVAIDIFAVGFHVALLEISRKAMHVLIVRQDCFGFCTEEIVIPDTDQRQNNRQVLLVRRG